MNNLEIVNKLIGPINPVGNSGIDAGNFENLKQMCELVESLIVQIDNVYNINKDSYEHSVKVSAEYASNFLTNRIGISND